MGRSIAPARVGGDKTPEAGGLCLQSGFRHESASRLLRQASHAKRLWSDPARAVNNSLRGGVADPDGPYRSRSGAPYSVSSSQLKESFSHDAFHYNC